MEKESKNPLEGVAVTVASWETLAEVAGIHWETLVELFTVKPDPDKEVK